MSTQLNPGRGLLFFSKESPKINTQFWSGPMILTDGTEVRLNATLQMDAKKPSFEVKVLRIPQAADESWKLITEFKLPTFGDLRRQNIKCKELGGLIAENGSNCVRITQNGAQRELRRAP